MRRPPAVDLAAAIPTVTRTVIREPGRGLLTQQVPKTIAERRTIALPRRTVELLRRRGRPGGPSESRRRLRDPSDSSGDLRAALDRAGSGWGTSPVLRKTVAARLDEAGLSARQIAVTSPPDRPPMGHLLQPNTQRGELAGAVLIEAHTSPRPRAGSIDPRCRTHHRQPGRRGGAGADVPAPCADRSPADRARRPTSATSPRGRAAPDSSHGSSARTQHAVEGGLVLAALGIVAGDIGTSPLYGLQTVSSLDDDGIDPVWCTTERAGAPGLDLTWTRAVTGLVESGREEVAAVSRQHPSPNRLMFRRAGRRESRRPFVGPRPDLWMTGPEAVVRRTWCTSPAGVADTLDRLQRRHPAAGFPLAVVYEYVDDSGP